MRAMGELLLANTNFKTFADFATAYLGPWAGFFLGWSYWCNWIITAIADVIVIGGICSFGILIYPSGFRHLLHWRS